MKQAFEVRVVTWKHDRQGEFVATRVITFDIEFARFRARKLREEDQEGRLKSVNVNTVYLVEDEADGKHYKIEGLNSHVDNIIERAEANEEYLRECEQRSAEDLLRGNALAKLTDEEKIALMKFYVADRGDQ